MQKQHKPTNPESYPLHVAICTQAKEKKLRNQHCPSNHTHFAQRQLNTWVPGSITSVLLGAKTPQHTDIPQGLMCDANQTVKVNQLPIKR